MTDVLAAVVVAGFAAWRVTRLVVQDSILDPPRQRWRQWLAGRDGYGWYLLEELQSCQFCLGVHAAWVLWMVLAAPLVDVPWRGDVLAIAAAAGVQAAIHEAAKP